MQMSETEMKEAGIPVEEKAKSKPGKIDLGKDREKPVKVKAPKKAPVKADPDEDEGDDETDEAEVKASFVAALNATCEASKTLAIVVQEALDAGYDTQDLVDWGMEAGWSESRVRGLVSKEKRAKGIKTRNAKEGGKLGRATPDGMEELRDYAVEKYGEDAAKLLLSAYRSLKASAMTHAGDED